MNFKTKISLQDPSHAHLEVDLWFVHSKVHCMVLYVCTKFEVDTQIRSQVMWGHKIWKLGHMTPAIPI